MKTLIKSMIIQSLALLLSASLAFAEERSRYEQPELDQMLAPIALYPDPLLSQILMASTYPLEVVQAARWSRAYPQLKGQDAVRAAENHDWDPSVKSLVAFPQIIAMMDQKLDWTERLGDAFLMQQEQVMDTVQGLRRRAEAAGNLHPSDYARIVRQDETIIIEPVNPQVIYVPYYSPIIVYGPWWWPAYPPVYWAPWPGYHAGPAFASGFYWGSGITISAGFFFGAFDWHDRHVRVVNVHHFHNHAHVSRRATVVHDRPAVWRHDPGHRRGVLYRHAALRQEFGHVPAARAEARRDARERNAGPTARREDAQISGLRGGADRLDSRAEPGTNPRMTERRNADASRERREFLESRGRQPERPAAQGNNRPAGPRASPRIDGRADERGRPDLNRERREFRESRGTPPGRPAVQSNDRRAEPAPQPRLDERANERARPDANRERREFRESRGAQPGRPAAQANDRRSEPRREEMQRPARSLEPRPSVSTPAVRQIQPAEAQRPGPAAQPSNERAHRQGARGGDATTRPSAGNHPPRAPGGGGGRSPGSDAPRRSMPAAGRPAPG